MTAIVSLARLKPAPHNLRRAHELAECPGRHPTMAPSLNTLTPRTNVATTRPWSAKAIVDRHVRRAIASSRDALS